MELRITFALLLACDLFLKFDAPIARCKIPWELSQLGFAPGQFVTYMGGLFLVCGFDPMGYVDQAGGGAAAVIDTKNDLGALVCRFGVIEDAAVQFAYECRVDESADDVRTGLGAVSEDTQNLASIAQPNSGDQCEIGITLIALHHQSAGGI